jgi:hexosaminidase
MKNAKTTLSLLLSSVLLIATACAQNDTAPDLSGQSIIPKPVSVVPSEGAFTLTHHSDIFVQGESEALLSIGQYLADKLKPSTGYDLEVKTLVKDPGRGDIVLALSENDQGLGDEGYEMVISEKSIRLTAGKPAGMFYGVQTMLQLLPPEVEKDSLQDGPWHIPAGTIRDFPVYGYRGAMLDVARHFFTPDEVKTYIDHLATYKMNVLHLHLTDDQGWRIEIKSWPELTAHGGKTEVGGGEGGYFTQEQYSDIVRYAQDRFVTIIPEIDMPGHTNAALSSYPELNVGGKATDLYTGINVGFSSLDTKSETTYKFVDDVIRELAALTPGAYIHIGGDESHATKVSDYIPFVSRVQDIAISHGKKVLGWDEIALSSLKPNTIVQYWARAANAVKGVMQGARVLMSPAKYAYLDMKYDSTTIYGLNWAGYIEVDKAYNWDPASLVPEIKKENIIGIEAPLWSETVSDLTEAQYLIFPRLLGFAEIGWTPAELRSWDDYKVRLAEQGRRMKAIGINFYPSPLIEWNSKAAERN